MADALSQDDIDTLLAAADVPHAGESSPRYAALRPQGRTVRKMDFARPSKFNKDQLRTLQMIHENFCRLASTRLSGNMRSVVELSVAGAEQIPYGDFVDTLPVPTFASVLELTPLGTNAMASIDLPLLFAIFDRMLGGPGSGNVRVRELTDIEVGLASSFVESLLGDLSAAWGDLTQVSFRLRGVEKNAQFAQIASASEPSVLVNMQLSIGTAVGTLSICLPHQSIEAIVGELTAQRYFAAGEELAHMREQMLVGLQQVQMPVRVEVGSTRLPIERVLALGPGDVVQLDRRVTDGVELAVGNTRTFRAMPGRDGRHVAVRVIAPITPEEPAP